ARLWSSTDVSSVGAKAGSKSGTRLLRQARQWLDRTPQSTIVSAQADHSLTHAGQQAFALALRQSSYRGVGLDFEPWRPLDERHRRLMLSRREDALLGAASSRDLLRIWTVKEALFKADRGGQQRWVIAYELDHPARRSGTARVRAGGRVRRFRYISIEVPGGMLSAAFALND
ncbi:MAG TPA: 4'-phosphopantetheinyl transferase superfamily protein, partial [Dongiaceae bacterium]|nr:4'-phosphopantetheinyl transferase superfamily protein [Dongiaceae bacterium]